MLLWTKGLANARRPQRAGSVEGKVVLLSVTVAVVTMSEWK